MEAFRAVISYLCTARTRPFMDIINTGYNFYVISYLNLSRLRAFPKYFGKVYTSACRILLRILVTV